MTKSEKRTLMKMLPQMTQFIMQTGGKSLISRIYGVYMVEYPGMAPIFLMLQRNNIKLMLGNELLNTFDLKGSHVNRQVLEKNDHELSKSEDLLVEKQTVDTLCRENFERKMHIDTNYTTTSIHRRGSTVSQILRDNKKYVKKMSSLQSKIVKN